MNIAPRTLALLLLAALTGCSSTPARDWSVPDPAADAKYQLDTLRYLASPHLEGRGPGTRGLDLAAVFIADQFRKAGLQPLPGRTDYFQPFEFNMGLKVDDARTSLTLAGEALPLSRGGDAPGDIVPNTVTARDKAFSGDVVFAGYGIASRQRGYDDFAGVDLKGKIALIMRYEPRDAAGKSRFVDEQNAATAAGGWSADAGIARKIMAAQQRGAAAVLLVNPPPVGNAPADDSLTAFPSRGTRGGAGGVSVPVLQVSRAAVDRALSKRGLPSLATLAGAIDSTGKPASRTLDGLAASGEVRLVPNKVWVRNVIGLLPAPAGAKFPDEYVVVGAHYDHLGFGGPGSLAGNVNALHPGADDNASGTTSMLTLARRLGASRPADLQRNVIFQAYTIEEQGLVGSQFYVDNPLIPLSKTAYMLNLDMVGRLKNDIVLHGGEGTADSFPAILDNAFAGTGLTPRSMGKGGIGPSDHASFARKRVPVLFLFTGLHPQYHRPADTWQTINFPGMLRVTDVAEKILISLSQAPRDDYNVEADRFRQDVMRQDSMPGVPNPATTPPTTAASTERVGLGLMPDMVLRDKPGMRIEAVTPGSAADRAGLKAEDVLIDLDGTPISSVEDLQAVYDRHKPGNKVKATYERQGKRTTTEVTFARRAPAQ